MAIAAGIIPPFELIFRAQKADLAGKAAASYLVKKHIVRQLMALDFGIDERHLHFVPQVSYHLDCYLTPGPGHSFFITSFAFLAELLEQLIAHAPSLQLMPPELALLMGYKETAQKMHQELSPLLDRAQKSLESQGFQVIPLPQHVLFESQTFYQEFPVPTAEMNAYFGNALTGYAEKTKKYYYIAHGFHAGLQCGPLMRQLFYLALKAYVPDVELYFIGCKRHHPEDFSEALDAWSRLDTQYGIHCTTFPLQKAEE